MNESKLYSLVDYDESYFDKLFQFHKENFIDYFISHYGKWNDNRQSKAFKRQIENGDYKVIISGGEVVGCVNVLYSQGQKRPRVGGDIVIYYLNIGKKYQGNGVGTAVLRKIARIAQNQNSGVVLRVYKDNPKARQLYERMGYYIDWYPSTEDENYITMKYYPRSFYKRCFKGAIVQGDNFYRQISNLPPKQPNAEDE